jgi:hypothetical protein
LNLSLIQKIKSEEDFSKFQANLIINSHEEIADMSIIDEHEKIIKSFIQDYLKKISIRVKCTAMIYTNVKIGKSCCKCNINILPSDAKYVCYTCSYYNEDFSLCLNCVPDYYLDNHIDPFHIHPLMYFPPDSDKMGEKMTPFDLTRITESDMNMIKFCNSCQSQILEMVFTCAVCDKDENGYNNTYDLCPFCFKMSQDPKKSSLNMNTSHDNKKHPMIRSFWNEVISFRDQTETYLKI